LVKVKKENLKRRRSSLSKSLIKEILNHRKS